MKAAVGDRIRLTQPVESDFERNKRTHSPGTEGVIVEAFEDPEGYYADVRVGDGDYDNIVVKPEQFEVIRKGTQAR
jgi:hypothetical protein